MKKIYINRTPKYNQSFGGGNNFVQYFIEYFNNHGYKITDPSFGYPSQADLIFIMDPRPDDGDQGIYGWHQYYNKIPIIHRVNEIDCKRAQPIGIDSLLRETSKISDLSIFVSKWLQEEHNRLGWYCPNQVVLYNGVDTNIFKDYDNKINDGKIHIFTHHWSADRAKGQDIHEWVDNFVGRNKDKFEYHYIGRKNFDGHNTKFIDPLHGIELAKTISQYDICINGSRWEPGSNSLIESMACGKPCYVYKDNGGSTELVGEDHIFYSKEEMEHILIPQHYIKNIDTAVVKSDGSMRTWNDCFKELQAMLQGRNLL